MVTHASSSTLRTCLEALPVARLHGVVVVDNASPDDSAAIARRVPGVVVVEQANTGFGAGCNTGIAALGGAELVLLLNPDATVAERDLLALVAHLDARPRCALVGPRLWRDGTPLTSGGRPAGLLTELRLVAPAALARHLPDRRLPPDRALTGPVGYVEGACFLVRAEDLRGAGGFDEAFFLFYEELDLARRLALRGRTVELLATASAQHRSAVSREQLPDRGRAHLLASAVIYLHRRSSVLALVYVLLGRLSLLVRRRGGLDRSTAADWSRALRAGHRRARGVS